jgi:CO/xanthine dehydrogenase FAD-binding subunit
LYNRIVPVLLPTTIDETVRGLSEHPDHVLLAGGTDLMVAVNHGHRRIDASTMVISLTGVSELRQWTLDHSAGTVRIGSGVTWRELLAEPFASVVTSLADAARTVGSPQIRSAGTIGGNLATSSPAGDGLGPLSALDATVEVTGPSGVRHIPYGEFATGVKRTVLDPTDLITAVTVPIVRGWQGYAKVGVRNAMVIATASVALVADADRRSVAISLGSVGPTVLRCPEAELLASRDFPWDGGRIEPGLLSAVADSVRAAARPIDDHRSSADYRRHAVGVLARRLLERAASNLDRSETR